jgi:hypothetical protein
MSKEDTHAGKEACKTYAHAEEEGMQGTHSRRPSQDRVRVFVRERNGWYAKNMYK